MNSIIIIIPYFGKFPKYFPFWLQSAYNNPTIDFVILTDNKLLESRDNIQIIYTNFDELKKEIQSKFDFAVDVSTPYKLCDYKACHGFIFPEYVKKYDFWGFCDVDLVFGDIRHFFTDDILRKYDVISGWGHLTLYRNNEYCNNFFKIKKDGFQYYKEVFSRPKGVAYCEFNHMGLSDLWTHLHPDKIWNSKMFDDIRVPRLSFNFISEFHTEHSNQLIFEYEGGNLYRIYINSSGELVKEETLYAHFQQRKFMKVLTSNTMHYLIIPNSFINIEEITFKKLKRWTKPQTLNRHFWNLKNRLIRRIKKCYIRR